MILQVSLVWCLCHASSRSDHMGLQGDAPAPMRRLRVIDGPVLRLVQSGRQIARRAVGGGPNDPAVQPLRQQARIMPRLPWTALVCSSATQHPVGQRVSGGQHTAHHNTTWQPHRSRRVGLPTASMEPPPNGCNPSKHETMHEVAEGATESMLLLNMTSPV